MNLKVRASELKSAALSLMSLSETQRKLALNKLAEALLLHEKDILDANSKDLEAAKASNLKASLIDRLTLTPASIKSMSQSCLEIANAEGVLNKIIEETKRADGLVIQKERIPLGLIAMIFESRPNVVIDAAALCIKSGNALILKGGKEAQFSNEVLFNMTKNISDQYLVKNTIELLLHRDEVTELLKLHEYVDVVVPRGGEALVKMVKENATMPVIAHDKGLCHLYIHEDASIDKAINIVTNAKTHRPGVCNALESLLIHEKWNLNYKKQLLKSLQDLNVELRVSHDLLDISEGALATETDYQTEYLDLILSVKTVTNIDQAIMHIKKYGSHHTEGIISEDLKVIEKFLNHLDASCIVINASTRFNDGGQLGLGAELGISTSKLHAYGPMGAEQMTTTRYIVRGDGHIRK